MRRTSARRPLTAPFDTVRAHLNYWKRPVLGERLYDAIVESNTTPLPMHASCAPSPLPGGARCYME